MGTLFDTASLHKIIDETLAASNIPPEHKNAFVLMATASGTVKAVLTTKINDVWSVNAIVSVQKGQHVEASAEVKASW